MKTYTREQLLAELERRGCRRHHNPGGVVVPIGEMWIHPDGFTRITIPRAGIDGTYPEAVVLDLIDQHEIPEPMPGN